MNTAVLTSAKVPDLTSVSAVGSGGDLCLQTGNWIITVGWNTTNPDDGGYRIDIDRSVDGGAFSSWLVLIDLREAMPREQYDTWKAAHAPPAGWGGLAVHVHYDDEPMKRPDFPAPDGFSI